MRKQILSILAVAATISFAAPSAHAYYEAPWSSFDFLQDQAWSQINNRLTNQRLDDMNAAIARTQAARSASAEEGARPLDLGEGATTDLAPLRPYLAQIQLTEAQAGKILTMYHQVATTLDVPANDSASGVAAFLAGSYAAYTNEPFPDALFKPLYDQFAETLASDETLTERPLAERIEYYQRLVVGGMLFQLLQLDMQQNPQPDQIAAMRKAAESAFTEIAGISPDRIRFTVDGLAPN